MAERLCAPQVEGQGSAGELEKWSGSVSGEGDECERRSETDVYERFVCYSWLFITISQYVNIACARVCTSK